MRPSSRGNTVCRRSSARARPLHESRTVSESASMAGAVLSPSCSRCAMSSSGHVSWFADVGLEDRPHVGGKGGSLGELQRAAIAVPPGFVVRTAAFEGFLQTLEREAPVRAQVEALSAEDLDS